MGTYANLSNLRTGWTKTAINLFKVLQLFLLLFLLLCGLLVQIHRTQ